MRRLGLPLVLIALGLVGAAPAGATVSVGVNSTTDRLEITDVSGASDLIVVSSGEGNTTAGTLYFVESAQPLTAAPSCSAPDTAPSGRFRTRCLSLEIRGITATLGAGNDDWTDTHRGRVTDSRDGEIAIPSTVNGGLGNDVLRGSEADGDSLLGSDGNDQLVAGKGVTTLAGGNGADTLTDGDSAGTRTPDRFSGGNDSDVLTIKGGGDTALGEAGADTVFEENAAQVADTVDGGADEDRWVAELPSAITVQDGERSANVFGDSVLRSEPVLEQVVGAVEIYEGTNSADVMNGALIPPAVGHSYRGRGGADVLVGSDGANGIVGGNGRDVMQGRDGNDDLDAKAGEAVAVPDQLIDCGPGTADTTKIDLLDPDPAGCESVARSAIGEGPHLRIGRVRRARGGAFAVGLSCPRRLGHRCRGSLELAVSSRGLGPARAKRYSIAAGRGRTVKLRLGRRDSRRLRRLRRRSVLVRSLERGDVAGKKTTLARRRLRR